jgi:hypothetical protein
MTTTEGFSPGRRSLLLGGLGTASAAVLGPLALGGPAAATPARAAADFDLDTGNFIIELIGPFQPGFNVIAPMDVTILHRFVHLSIMSWFDATAPYHPTRVGVHSRLGRRPSSESATNRNRTIAALHANYQVVKGIEPRREPDFRALMTAVGLNPDDESESRTSPVGLGNLAGKAVVAAALRDGMNQLGDTGRRYNPKPYADYTGYRPVNTAFELTDPSRWQPGLGPHSRRLGGSGGDLGIFVVQQFATPQLRLARAHTFADPRQFTLAPPDHTDHTRPRDYQRSVDEILAASAALTDHQKVAAEYFDDKTMGLGQSVGFAAIAHADHLTLDQMIDLGFTSSVALWDSMIACWHQKTKYDAVRPFSAVRHVYGRQKVTAWGGPGKGTVDDIRADEWSPYLNTGDHPDYPSGSTVLCSAQAQATRRFLGDDTLNLRHVTRAGTSVREPGHGPAADVELFYPTWESFVRECALSRLWGGVHFKKTVERSITFGEQFGDRAYRWTQRYIRGEA